MHWRMFEPTSEASSRHRLHLLVDREDTGYQGLSISYGFVEQTPAKGTLVKNRSGLKFTAVINDTGQEIGVPDLETGMAVLMMNVKGNQNGNT